MFVVYLEYETRKTAAPFCRCGLPVHVSKQKSVHDVFWLRLIRRQKDQQILKLVKLAKFNILNSAFVSI